MAVADRFYTPGQDTTQDGIEVDYLEHVLPYDGHRLHVYEWPVDAPVGVVFVAHGAGQHGRHYQRLANRLRQAGWAVVADDHLGHGRTGVDSALGLGRLDFSSNPGAKRALRESLRWTRARYAGLRLVLLGHSWGSLMGQQLLYAEPQFVDGAVFTGTSLALPGFINPGNFNRKWQGDGHGMSWLTRDPAEIQGVVDDLYGFDMSQSPGWSIFGSVELMSMPPILARRGRAARIPVLVLTGTEDPLGFSGRGPRALVWWLRHLSRFHDVEFHAYAGARHDLFSETNRDEVIADLVRWLDWHFGALPAPVTAKRAGASAH